MSQVVRLPPDRLPGKGDIVAIDAEFVSLTVSDDDWSLIVPVEIVPLPDMLVPLKSCGTDGTFELLLVL